MPTDAEIDDIAEAMYVAQGIVYAGTDPGPFKTWPDEDKEYYRTFARVAVAATGVEKMRAALTHIAGLSDPEGIPQTDIGEAVLIARAALAGKYPS